MASNAGLPSNSEEDSSKTVDYAFASRSEFPESEGTTFVSSVCCSSSSSGPSSLLQFPPSSPFNICHMVCDREGESKQTRALLFLPQPGISSCILETAEDGERDDLLRDRDKRRIRDEGRAEEKDEGSVERQKHTAEERKATLHRQEREVDIKEGDSSIQEGNSAIFEGSAAHPAPLSSAESVVGPTRSEHDACSAQASFRSDLDSRLRKQGVFRHTSAQLCRRQGASGDFSCRKRGEGAAKRKKKASRGNSDGWDSDSNPTLSSQRLCKDFTSVVVAGRGGCGRVLKATHVLDGQTYAIKEIKFAANREHLDAHMAVFLREVLCLRRLDAHPNIVRYFNSWVEVSPPPLTPENAIDHTSLLASQDQVPVGTKTSCVRSPQRPSMRGLLAGSKTKKVFKDDTLRWKKAEGGDATEGSDKKMSQTPRIRYSSCGLVPECEEVCDRNPDHGGRKQNGVQAFRDSILITACNGALAEDDKEVTDKSKMPGPCPSRDGPPCVSFPTGRPKMSTRSTIQIGHNKHRQLPQTTLTVTGARLRPRSNCPRGANAPFENSQRTCLRKEGLPSKVAEFFPVQHGCSDPCVESPEEVDRKARQSTTKDSGKKDEGRNADGHSVGTGWAAMRGEKRNDPCRRNHVSETLNAELETTRKDFLRLHNAVSRRLVVSNTHDGNYGVLHPSCNDQSYALEKETGASATDCERWSDGGTQEPEDSREARDKENRGYDVAKRWTEDVGKQETEEDGVSWNGQGTSIAFQNVGHAFGCINSNRNDEDRGLAIALEAREEQEDAHRHWTRHTGDMQSPPDGETIPDARQKGGTDETPSWYRGPDKSSGEALRDKEDKYSSTTGKSPPESSSAVWSDGRPVTSADWTSVRKESRPAVRDSIRNMGKKNGTKILAHDDFWPCYEFYSDDNGEDGLQIVFAEVDPGGAVSSTRNDGVKKNEEDAAGPECSVDATSRSSGVLAIGEKTLVVSTQHDPPGKSDIRSRETERGGSGRVEMGEVLMNQMANEVTLQEKVGPFPQPSSRQPWDISLFAVGEVTASDKGEGTPESYGNHHATMSTADTKERSYKPRTRRHSCGYPRYPEERPYARRGRSQSLTPASDRLPDEAIVGSKGEAQHRTIKGAAAKVVDASELRNLEEAASAGLIQSAVGTRAVLRECHRSTIPDDGNGVSIRNEDVSLPLPRSSYHRKRHLPQMPLTGGVDSSEILRYKGVPQSERQGNGRQETTVVNLRHGRETIKGGVQSNEMRGHVRAKANTSQKIPDLPLSRQHFLGLSDLCERNQRKVAVSLYIQMEYCGMSLDEYIAQTPEVDPERNEEIVAMIISGLYQCHSAGVMHRDLKPSNIFIDKETGVVKIGDFGLAFSEDMKQVPSSGRDRVLFENDISSKNRSSIVTPNSETPDSRGVYGKQDQDCLGASSGVLYGGGRGVKEVLKGGEESVQTRISRANTGSHPNLGKEEHQHYHRTNMHNLNPLPIYPFLSATPLAGGARPHSSDQDGTLYKTQVLQSSPGETPCFSCPASPKRGPHGEMSSAERSSLLAERTILISGVDEEVRKSVDGEKISVSLENFPGLCPSELPTGAVEHVAPSSLVVQKSRNDPTELKKEALSSISPVVGEVPSVAKVHRSHAACLTPPTTWGSLPNCQSPVLFALRRDLEISETTILPSESFLSNVASTPHESPNSVACLGPDAFEHPPNVCCTVNVQTVVSVNGTRQKHEDWVQCNSDCFSDGKRANSITATPSTGSPTYPHVCCGGCSGHHDTTRLSMAPSCMKYVSLPASISGTPRLASTPARTCSCGWQRGYHSCCASPVKTVCQSPLHLSLDSSGCVHSPCTSPHSRSQLPVLRCRNLCGLHWPTSVVPLHRPCSCVAGNMHERDLWSPRMGFAASAEGGRCCGIAGGPCCGRRCRAPPTCGDPYCHLCDSFEEGDEAELRLDVDRNSPKIGREKSCVSSRTDSSSPETGLPNSARVSAAERGIGQGTSHLVPETSQSGRLPHEFRRFLEQRVGTIDECYNQMTVLQTNMVTSGIPEGTIERLPSLSEEMNDGNQDWTAKGANAKDSSSCCPSVRCRNSVKGTENTAQSPGCRLSRSLSLASPAYLNEETREKAPCVSPELLCGGQDPGWRGGATAVHEGKTVAEMCSMPCHENTARHRCPSLPCTPRDGPPIVPALFEKRTSGVGTRAYAPPEQLQGGRYDFSVDIWALGFIVLDLFTRCNTAMEQATNFRNARDGRFPPSVTSTYPWIVPFCRWCLQNDPSKRPTIRQLYQHYWSTGSVFGPKTAAPKYSASGLLSHTEGNTVAFPLCLPLPHLWTGACLPHRLLPSDDFFHSPPSGVPVNVDSHERNDDEVLVGTVGLGQARWQNSVVAVSPPACVSCEVCDQGSSSCFDAHVSGQSHPPQSYASSPLRIPCNHSCFPADLIPLSLRRSPRESAHTSTCVAGERSCGDTARIPTCVCGPSAHASPAISTRLVSCACPITGPCRGEAVDEPSFCVVRDSEGEDNSLLSGCSCVSIYAGSTRRPESPWQGQHMNTPSTCPSTAFTGYPACQCPVCACCVCRGCSGAVCEVFPAEGLTSSAASGGPVSPTALQLSSEGRMFKDTSSDVWGQSGVASARCRMFPIHWPCSTSVVHGDESKTSPPNNWSRPAQEPDSYHLWYMLPPPRTLLP